MAGSLCIRGNLKSTVYATEVIDIQDLQQRVQKGYEIINSH